MECFCRLFSIPLAPLLQEPLQGGGTVLLNFDELGPPILRKGHKLSPSVIGIGPAMN